MITDRIDGDIARSRGLVTNFGKVADPIADKALMTMALVGLSLLGEVWWWVTIVVLVREWGITAVRFGSSATASWPPAAAARSRPCCRPFGIGLFVIPRWTLPFPDLWEWLASIVLGAAVVVTVVTGIDYLHQALRLRRTSERARAQAGRARGSGPSGPRRPGRSPPRREPHAVSAAPVTPDAGSLAAASCPCSSSAA